MKLEISEPYLILAPCDPESHVKSQYLLPLSLRPWYFNVLLIRSLHLRESASCFSRDWHIHVRMNAMMDVWCLTRKRVDKTMLELRDWLSVMHWMWIISRLNSRRSKSLVYSRIECLQIPPDIFSVYCLCFCIPLKYHSVHWYLQAVTCNEQSLARCPHRAALFEKWIYCCLGCWFGCRKFLREL